MSDNDLSNTLKKFGSAPLPTGGLPQAATLRDQFAMAALTGLFSIKHLREMSDEDLAAISYTLADAMMEARK